MTEKDKKLLETVGEALFGPRWQTDTARVLGYDDPARLRRILAGDRPFPDDGWQLLAAELRRRSADALTLAAKLEKM